MKICPAVGVTTIHLAAVDITGITLGLPRIYFVIDYAMYSMSSGGVALLAGDGDGGVTGYVDGIGTTARFHGLSGITYLSELLYTTEEGNHVVRLVTTSGWIEFITVLCSLLINTWEFRNGYYICWQRREWFQRRHSHECSFLSTLWNRWRQ